MDFHLFCSAHGVSWFRVASSAPLRSGIEGAADLLLQYAYSCIYTCFIQFRTSNQSDGTLVLYSMFFFAYPIIPNLYGESFPGFEHFDLQAMPVMPVMPAAHSWMDSMVW